MYWSVVQQLEGLVEIMDPYKRLLGWYDEQVALGAAGTYNATPVLYRPGCTDGNAPPDIRSAVYVTRLGLSVLEGHAQPVIVSADGPRVEWFELDLGVGGRHRITIDREYHDDDTEAIEALLVSAGL